VWLSDFFKQPPTVPVLKQVQNQRTAVSSFWREKGPQNQRTTSSGYFHKNIKELTGFGGKNQKRDRG
jgi:hypothetical protein